MEIKRKVFLNWLVILLALLVFSGMLLFGVYASLSFHGDDVGAYAAEENQVYNFNQLVQNGDFSSTSFWNASNSSILLSSSSSVLSFSFSGTPSYVTSYYLYQPSFTSVIGHRLLFLFSYNIPSSLDVRSFDLDSGFYNYANLINDGSWHTFYSFGTSSSSKHNSFRIVPYLSTTISYSSAVIYYSNCQVLDLTQIFGAGNEPTTIEEFRAIFPSEYYNYTTGTLVAPSYDQGYTDGYHQGFSDGGVDYLNSLSSPSWVSDALDIYVPDHTSSLFDVIQDDYWTSGYFPSSHVTSYREWDIDQGYNYIYNNYSWYDLVNCSLSISWYSPVCRATSSGITYGYHVYKFTSVDFVLSEPSNYIIFKSVDHDDYAPLEIYMYLHASAFHIPYFDNGASNSLWVPNLNPSLNVGDYNIYKFYFYVTPSGSVQFQDGYDTGVRDTLNSVNTTSASYIKGFQNGVQSAHDYSFYNLITSVIDVPITTFSSLTNFDFLGINLKAFVLSLLTLGVIIAVVRLLLGGKS